MRTRIAAEMSNPGPQPAAPQGTPPWFQFTCGRCSCCSWCWRRRWRVFGAWGIVIFGFGGGTGDLPSSKSNPCCRDLSCSGRSLLGVPLGMLLPASNRPRGVSVRNAGKKMEQIAVALQNYHRANGSFPPAYVTDKTGKPMHSWRVLLLAVLERKDDLYKGQPSANPGMDRTIRSVWPRTRDSIPARATRTPRAAVPQTSYVAVVGPNAAWARRETENTRSIFGGRSLPNTIMVIEAVDSGIAWSEPGTCRWTALPAADTKAPALTLSSRHGPDDDYRVTEDRRRGVNAAMADGSVRYLPPGCLSADRLPKLLQIGGCKVRASSNPVKTLTANTVASTGPTSPRWPCGLLSVGLLLTHLCGAGGGALYLDRRRLGPRRPRQLIGHLKIFSYSVRDVGQSVGFRVSLRVTARQTGNRDSKPFVGFLNNDLVRHCGVPETGPMLRILTRQRMAARPYSGHS